MQEVLVIPELWSLDRSKGSGKERASGAQRDLDGASEIEEGSQRIS